MSLEPEIIHGVKIPAFAQVDHPAACTQVLHELAACCARHLTGGGYFSNDEAAAILGEYQERLHGGAALPHQEDFIAFAAEKRALEHQLDQADEIRRMQKVLRWSVHTRVPFWSFGPLPGKPDSLYQRHPRLRPACQRLGCPAMFAGDSSIIHLAALNPYAALVGAAWIEHEACRDNGDSRPFVFPMLVDLPAWQHMLQRHFAS